jgi:hypothetical protein
LPYARFVCPEYATTGTAGSGMEAPIGITGENEMNHFNSNYFDFLK